MRIERPEVAAPSDRNSSPANQRRVQNTHFNGWKQEKQGIMKKVKK